jgi:hypothetical protein
MSETKPDMHFVARQLWNIYFAASKFPIISEAMLSLAEKFHLTLKYNAAFFHLHVPTERDRIYLNHLFEDKIERVEGAAYEIKRGRETKWLANNHFTIGEPIEIQKPDTFKEQLGAALGIPATNITLKPLPHGHSKVEIVIDKDCRDSFREKCANPDYKLSIKEIEIRSRFDFKVDGVCEESWLEATQQEKGIPEAWLKKGSNAPGK